ncbi:PREDICTED: oligodendrocyte-myelin glycoprotein-like isoform X1 [Cyprinodon variegatus]|uniref:oligodendrocyte-myelin glycoprotein-like isoform X1 n=1 Tax=Cyprinodon variegatus TaxID=28743 RepID=UPI0007428CB7|nr:PREDICTED: oligodendrocyte-myelin glycoprotein-like isoform X1 [Cyprinodon variegatus]
MRSRPALSKLILNEALLELVLVLLLGLRVLAVCPSMCSCSRSHREVDCFRKSLRELPDGLQHNILSLNLSHNRPLHLDGRLTSYTHLRVLDLSHNRLRRLPEALPRSLWELHASFNHIQLLDKNDTVYQWNLRILDLSNNKLERVIFINNTLTNLRMLNLSHNHFWTLPTNLPAHLETVDLSHNLLGKVLPGSLDRLPRLSHLYLHANRFSSLPFGVLDKMISLRVITLGNNPWACHLYADVDYLQSWTQSTSVLVLGCPCHTQPVCGGTHTSRTGGWNLDSFILPPLEAGTLDLSSISAEESVTQWFWSVHALHSTPQTRREALNTPHHAFTEMPIGISTLTINHLAGTGSLETIDHLISGTKETSDSLHTADSSHFSDKSLITDTSKGNDVEPASDRFFITEASSTQTKRTATLRTRSVRRHNQSPSGGIRNSSPALAPACSLLWVFHNFRLLPLIWPHLF